MCKLYPWSHVNLDTAVHKNIKVTVIKLNWGFYRKNNTQMTTIIMMKRNNVLAFQIL